MAPQQQPMGNNPFDMGFNTEPMNKPGPSPDSWNKDFADLGKGPQNSFQMKKAEQPTV
jgi:hypothetical protein